MSRRKALETGWRCPDCGRRFTQRTREHSCDVRTVASHLERASTEAREVYGAIRAALDACGPYEVVAVKTMVLFRGTTNFGGVVFRRAHVDLGFFLGEPLAHPRVARSERLSPSKSAHHVLLSSPDEVDAEVVGWLRRAYAVGLGGGRA